MTQSATPGRSHLAPQSAPRLRQVHRAMAELRRGVPILLRAPEPLLVLAAEGVSRQGLLDLLDAARLPCLLLGPARGADVLGTAVPTGPVVALQLPAQGREPAAITSLADPTAEQLLSEPPVVADVPQAAEAALMLVKLARLLPAAIVARLSGVSEAEEVAHRLGLVQADAAEVLSYPEQAAAGLVRVAEAVVPLEDAPEARLVAFRAPDAGIEHLALLVGRPEDAESPLVRLHSECFTGDLLGSLRCDCGSQLRQAIRRMAAEGAGALLYLAQEGRGIGLVNKLRAYALQDRGLDTLDANKALGWGVDERSFLMAATMLDSLGLRRLRLLTNNPDKVAALRACGIDVTARLSHAIVANGVNDGYLATKARRMGHLFS